MSKAQSLKLQSANALQVQLKPYIPLQCFSEQGDSELGGMSINNIF